MAGRRQTRQPTRTPGGSSEASKAWLGLVRCAPSPRPRPLHRRNPGPSLRSCFMSNETTTRPMGVNGCFGGSIVPAHGGGGVSPVPDPNPRGVDREVQSGVTRPLCALCAPTMGCKFMHPQKRTHAARWDAKTHSHRTDHPIYPTPRLIPIRTDAPTATPALGARGPPAAP